jgi:NTE family protein
VPLKAASTWIGASALLSAVDIWSTKPVAAEAPEAVAATADVKALEIEAAEREAAETELAETETFGTKIFDIRTPEINEVFEFRTEPASLARPAAAETVRGSDTKQFDAKHVDTKHVADVAVRAPIRTRAWPPRKLSLALQGGGSFGAFTWGVLDRLLEEPDVEFDAISGSSVGAVNAALVACGLIVDGREGARKLLARFWNRMTNEASFRSLMLIGGFSPAGSAVAFGQALVTGRFDPFDLDPLRRTLEKDIDFAALRASVCPRLRIAATRIRDGGQQIFRNAEITPDTLLASTCPPLIHCAVEIDGQFYWDGGYSGNPPVVSLLQDSEATDVLVVQLTPARDNYIPITSAAIDRRLDQIMANAALNAEIAALEWSQRDGSAAAQALRIYRLAAEDEIEGLAQRSSVDLGRGFITQLHRAGYTSADRWLRQTPNDAGFATEEPRKAPTAFWTAPLAPSSADAAV